MGILDTPAPSVNEAVTAGRGRSLDGRYQSRFAPDEIVLYRSDFDAGLDGWADMWSGDPYAQPWPPISRTSEMCYRGSHCLMVSTGEHASPSGTDISSSGLAVKRLSRNDNYRYQHLSAYIALGIGGFDQSWATVVLQMDTQSWDSATRSLYAIQCVSQGSGSGFYDKWQIRGNNNPGPATYYDVKDGSNAVAHRTFIGNNENKHNFMYVRLTVDMAANGGLGGYKQFQVGTQVYDLSGLGAGSSSEPPQASGSDMISDFNGGFNIGFQIIRNTSVQYGCQLFVDDVVLTASKTL